MARLFSQVKQIPASSLVAGHFKAQPKVQNFEHRRSRSIT